ncbi:MAG TPA: GNAT family N-acetyltransferase [Pseudolabrys sp.]|nr:GNAT family N-acetyltransferase [Pseudolabrys sp.]
MPRAVAEGLSAIRQPTLSVRLASRNEISGSSHWRSAFAHERKDHRYYELLEDTLKDGFRYGYLVIESDDGIRAIQPCFQIDQDLLAGLGERVKKIVAGMRRLWPRFMFARTLMVGCVAGEGHLDGDAESQFAIAASLARSLPQLARQLNCAMVVLKEFPAKYRPPLHFLRDAGFAIVPSMPMTTLGIDYRDFDDYLSSMLSPRTRGKVRRKLRAAERAQPAITMSVVKDVTPVIDNIYPLYERVYERSPLQFEKLTKEFLCEIGRRMPDKVRFFIWRQDSQVIAFGLCMVQGDMFSHDYVGFDYTVAFELNLYYRVFHDVIAWAIANGYKRFYSGSLNYDPKWHLRQSLYPVDLYVRHTSGPINGVLRRLLPLMEPTRSDPILPNFHNYSELWE